MADDKGKPKAPAPPSPFNKNHLRDTIIFLLVLLLIGGVITRLNYYFHNLDNTFANTLWQRLLSWFRWLWSFWKIFAIFLTAGFVTWAFYNRYRLRLLMTDEEKIYNLTVLDLSDASEVPVAKENKKWVNVIEHMNSVNSAEWRMAIIEADIMLDELLSVCGYHGDSVGEKLKGVEPSDMLTLDSAWEAHKIRNRIAHAGSDFELNERETKRIISLYESVFKEFQII